MMQYGMPYKGSKSKLAKQIVDLLPACDTLYDLFGGGGAVTHAACLSGKFRRVVYNEINPMVARGFRMAVNGEFRDEKRWISREQFFALRETDPYAAICFSFGNDTRSYCYGAELEPYKRALHAMLMAPTWQERRVLFCAVMLELARYLIVSDKGKTLKKWLEHAETGKPCKELERDSIQGVKRLESLDLLQILGRLTRLQSFESLERLGGLEQLQSLDIVNGDYQSVPLSSHGVIYCDPPYASSTGGYNITDRKNTFDYSRFYDWCRAQTVPVIISEFAMPEGFISVWQKKRWNLANQFGSDKKVTEHLFVPAHQLDWWTRNLNLPIQQHSLWQ